jgi:hypothetical protein
MKYLQKCPNKSGCPWVLITTVEKTDRQPDLSDEASITRLLPQASLHHRTLTMSKTLILAAALLACGMGAAFADGNVNAQPADISHASGRQSAAAGQASAFPTTQQHRGAWVYGQFANEGFAQGG